MRCHPARWLWGLIPIAMLSWLAVHVESDLIERDLEQRSAAVLAAAGHDWASVAFSGRDGLLVGHPVNERQRAEAVALVRGVWGVRVVEMRDATADTAELRFARITEEAPPRQALRDVAPPAVAIEAADRLPLAAADGAAVLVAAEPPQMAVRAREQHTTDIAASGPATVLLDDNSAAPAQQAPEQVPPAGAQGTLEIPPQKMTAAPPVPLPRDKAAVPQTVSPVPERKLAAEPALPASQAAPGQPVPLLPEPKSTTAQPIPPPQPKAPAVAAPASSNPDTRAAARAPPTSEPKTAAAPVLPSPRPDAKAAALAPPVPEPKSSAAQPTPPTEKVVAGQAPPPLPTPSMAAAKADVPAPTPAPRFETAALPQSNIAPDAACVGDVRGAARQVEVHFARGRAGLDSSGKALIDRLIGSLNGCPEAALNISGHADASGNPRRNLALSRRRARGVAAYMIDKGIDAGRLAAVGYGETRPVAPNDTRANRAKNRRIEVSITARNAPPPPMPIRKQGTRNGLSNR